MIKVILTDFNNMIKNNDLNKNNLSTLISIDCKMKIVYNNQTIYDDWVCPIELYTQIKDWNPNKISKFEYISEDNSINPIFSILNDDGWKFYSFNKLITELCQKDVINLKEEYIHQLLKFIKN